MARGTSPVVAVALLVGITVVLAAVLATTTFELGAIPDVDEPIVLDATASSNGEIVLVHSGGPTIDVSDVELRIMVDGEPLKYQPSAPFKSMKGFKGWPSGPLNSATDQQWEPGETTRFVVAGSNEPDMLPGADIVIRLLKNGLPIARAEVTVEE